MTTAYAAILAVTFLTLAALATLVCANGRISREDKNRYCLICGLISFAALWEWLAVLLNGAPAWTMGLHTFAKCMDYIFTPACSVLFVYQVAPKGRGIKPMQALLAGNTLLQIVSAFTGWTYYVDADNVYHHGPLYFMYTIVAVIAIVFIIVAFLDYGKKYARQNRGSLFASLALLAVGLGLQEIFGNEARVAYLSMAIASCMLFIHYT